jgi:hypothetical protein
MKPGINDTRLRASQRFHFVVSANFENVAAQQRNRLCACHAVLHSENNAIENDNICVHATQPTIEDPRQFH